MSGQWPWTTPADAELELENARRIYGADSKEYAEQLISCGDAFLLQSKDLQGKEHYVHALRICRALSLPSKIAHALDKLAALECRQGDYLAAYSHLREALHLWENLAQHAPSAEYVASKRSLLAEWVKTFSQHP
jgi:hypothetical protein